MVGLLTLLKHNRQAGVLRGGHPPLKKSIPSQREGIMGWGVGLRLRYYSIIKRWVLSTLLKNC